jgi:glycosyltransferase involved in cell wall biosynthesis
MRIAIDTWSLRPPLTGIGHYVHRLVGAMVPLLSPDQELLAFNGWGIEPIDRNFLIRAEARNSDQATGVSPRPFQHPRGKAYVLLRQTYPIRKAVRILQASCFRSAEKKFDLFHAVNYVAPARLHKPVLPVIYDLSFIQFPEAHPKERVDWLERELKRLADVPIVQTISEFSKSEIVALLGISPDRIHVTYPAPGEHFQLVGQADDVCLTKYRVAPRKYFLVVGTREPRKNFKTVAEAYTALPDALRNQFPLLWVGASGWGDLSPSPAIERAKDMGQIRIIGYVPDRDLAVLYRNTVLFVMPSVYEGFGMPVVEALACGAPVAVSKIPVFEEIAGCYARYIEPMDIEEWRSTMKHVAEGGDAVPRNDGLEAMLARYSWTLSAAMTLDLYRRLNRG